ncbi:hypothetical protein SAMN04487913_107197 [Arthrobacter sp. ok362]|jgi:hypothetical protein|nr:hypothetical protein SAMN04487913_107197 [Arthrobacter sp. ok362]
MDREKSGGSEDSNDGPPIQATLVIRVWKDTESTEPFRARIIAGSSEDDEPTISYARGRAEVVAAVNRWLYSLPDV